MSDFSARERLDELLALAALGELSETDERELDAALELDASLQSELDADLETAARIQAASPVQPPAELKRRLMDALGEPSIGEHVVGVGEQPDSVVSIADERKRRRSRWMPLLAAAAVALLAVAGVVITRDDGGGTDDLVARVIDAPDAEERAFEGDLNGSLTAVYSNELDALVLEGVDLDQISDAETLQLWLVGGDRPESVGVFRPDDDGQVVVGFTGVDPQELTLGVTIEPAGGSAQPTEPILATA